MDPQTNMRKASVKSFGCQMNVYDSERLETLLAQSGFEAGASMDESDIVILNTCHIREKASEKVYSELGRLHAIREARAAEGKNFIVGVVGCVAQADGEEIFVRAKNVDFVLGPQAYHHLDQALKNAEQGRRSFFVDFETQAKFENLRSTPTRLRAGQASAFVTVQEGCDKFCSFCVVPYTRGAEVSRAPSEILEETRRLADQGVREILFLGQNVNAYRRQENGHSWSLATLLAAAGDIPGVARLGYATSHPLDMAQDLIEAHRTSPKLNPYLHLPVQSGSDAVLRAMNRRHSADDYRALIEKIRSAKPNIALSSDFIVGFPGETDADFEATLKLVEDVGFASSFSFKYSRRPGTPGADFADQVPDEIKKERLARLQALLEEQRQAFNGACVGRRMPVLLEKKGRHDGQLIGRSPYMQSIYLVAPEHLIGEIVAVDIVATGPNALAGVWVGPSGEQETYFGALPQRVHDLSDRWFSGV